MSHLPAPRSQTLMRTCDEERTCTNSDNRIYNESIETEHIILSGNTLLGKSFKQTSYQYLFLQETLHYVQKVDQFSQAAMNSNQMTRDNSQIIWIKPI